uniref:Uncharacterized protein n=1 Tax=Tetraselmis sp. GSL018 TaxID=582737 RepID=A0A061RIN4_9CHLO
MDRIMFPLVKTPKEMTARPHAGSARWGSATVLSPPSLESLK